MAPWASSSSFLPQPPNVHDPADPFGTAASHHPAGIPGQPAPQLDLRGTAGLLQVPTAVPGGLDFHPGGVTLQGLVLYNLPPGAPASYPEGLGSVLLWTVDFKRCARAAVVTWGFRSGF